MYTELAIFCEYEHSLSLGASHRIVASTSSELSFTSIRRGLLLPIYEYSRCLQRTVLLLSYVRAVAGTRFYIRQRCLFQVDL